LLSISYTPAQANKEISIIPSLQVSWLNRSIDKLFVNTLVSRYSKEF